jgi:integrase
MPKSPKTSRRFTATSIATLPVGEHTDASVPGLQLRVSATTAGRSRTWMLRFKFRGEKSRIVLGRHPTMSLAAAREIAFQLRQRAAEGIDPRRAIARKLRQPSAESPGPSTHADHTISALAADFLARQVRPQLKRPEQVEQRLARHVLPQWGHRDARTIKPRDVNELTDTIADNGSPVEANRVKNVIGQLFSFAIVRGVVETSPVIRGYLPGGREKPRERVLSDEELGVILNDPTGALRMQRTAHSVLVLLATGARRGELARAEWKDVDLERRIWRIPAENSKNGLEHSFHITAIAYEHFSALRRLSEGSRWVMPASARVDRKTTGDNPIDPKLLTRSVARCTSRLKLLKVAPFTVHDLRRTVRTGLARVGVRPDIAERVLNHKLDKLLLTYDRHGYLDERRDALERWAAHLKTLVKQT